MRCNAPSRGEGRARPGLVARADIFWAFSILTIAAERFLLQPGMGLGWAASKTPNPWKVRAMGLVAHTVFAVGMWVPVAI